MPSWIYIGLLAQFFWVIGSIIDKSLLEKYFPEKLEGSSGALVVISGCFSALLALGICLFFYTELVFVNQLVLLGLVAGLLNGLWLHLYLVATHITEVSRTIPIFQTIPIFGLGFAFIALGETLAVTEIIGIIMLLCGAFVLSFDWKSKEWLLKPTLFMLLAAAIVALQETLFKFVSEGTSYWTAALLLTAGLALYALVVFLTNTNTRKLFMQTFSNDNRSVWWVSAINEVLDNGAYLLFVFAITLGPVALVQSVNAFQPLILLVAVTLLAKFFNNNLNEDVSYQTLVQKVLGVIIITTGSYFIFQTF